jgi:hypothetical protein
VPSLQSTDSYDGNRRRVPSAPRFRSPSLSRGSSTECSRPEKASYSIDRPSTATVRPRGTMSVPRQYGVTRSDEGVLGAEGASAWFLSFYVHARERADAADLLPRQVDVELTHETRVNRRWAEGARRPLLLVNRAEWFDRHGGLDERGAEPPASTQFDLILHPIEATVDAPELSRLTAVERRAPVRPPDRQRHRPVAEAPCAERS